MPRIIESPHESRSRFPDLVAELVNELRANRECGQPVIREYRFPKTDAVRVTVIWDKWEPLSDEDRIAVILDAYEDVESRDFRDRIALAMGLTVPEAHDAGLLPIQVTAALRPDDPVTREQCRQAIVAQGASTLSGAKHPQLRFATVEEAEACVKRLAEELPGSESVWVISQDVAHIAD